MSVVMKFGGTSVADQDAIRRVTAIVRQQIERQPASDPPPATEAFEDTWYWSSTQFAGYESYAWSQGFSHGFQDGYHKDDELRARAVRRLPIQ